MKYLLILCVFTSFVFAKINIAVSIIPQKNFVEKIAGEKANVFTIVKPGASPHTYEPKPSELKEISQANIYFPIKIDFENAWLKKFVTQNRDMKIVEMTKGVNFITMKKHKHHDGKEETIIKSDPHTWTSALNVKIMAKTIYETLIEIDAANKEFYKNNYLNFLDEINLTDKKIREILIDVNNNSKFMVFHPAWGYFAREYGLVQFPVEIEGKEPKPKELIKIIEEAKKENIKAIFTQSEFSTKSAQTIADSLNIKVLKETPLAEDWSENLIKMANAIANNN
jgi:zinc transport system substrate-binding protein